MFILSIASCNSSSTGPDDMPAARDMALRDMAVQVKDMAPLTVGQECEDGIGGSEGQCAAGLKCCVVACLNGPFDGGCLDQPSQCQPQPPPTGYGPCF